MTGDENVIDVLKQDGPFSGKIRTIWDVVRGSDDTAKRLLAEWLLARLQTDDDRSSRHVSLLALARVEAALDESEFREFVQEALCFYEPVTESLRDDDPLVAIATNATAVQRGLLQPLLGPFIEGDGIRRDAAMLALIKIVALSENSDERAKLATMLQGHAIGNESGEIQRATQRRRKA